MDVNGELKVFVTIQKKIRGGGVGCFFVFLRRIEVCVKIQKKIGGGEVRVRVDVNEEVKFFLKINPKIIGLGGSGRGGIRSGGGRVW